VPRCCKHQSSSRVACGRAAEYIVRFVNDQPGAQPPRDETWAKAIDGAADAAAFAVGATAYLHGRYDDARIAFTSAKQSSASEAAASAGFNLGVTSEKLQRPKEALGVYEDVVARFGDADQPALREPVAAALFNKGVTTASGSSAPSTPTRSPQPQPRRRLPRRRARRGGGCSPRGPRSRRRSITGPYDHPARVAGISRGSARTKGPGRALRGPRRRWLWRPPG
jgi:hypothetical protein